MDRLIRLAAEVPLADSVSKQPARRRPPHSFFNVPWLTLAIAGTYSMSAPLLRSSIVAGLLLLGTGGAYAEGNCPDGYYPVGGRDFAGCAPIPGSGSQRQAPQQPVEQWERRWGAVAIDSPKAVMGVAVDKRSKREASLAAASDCERQGGANCEIEAAYDNQCVAVITSNDSHNTPIALTVDQAVATGMKTCRDAGRTNCHVHYSACSLPVRIR